MKVIERFELYIKEKGEKLNAIDSKLELSSGYMSKQIKAKASIGSDILQKILVNYHDLSPVWLLTGVGDMLLDDNTAVDNLARQTDKQIIALQKQMLAGRDAEIEWHKHRIEKLQQQVKDLGGVPVESD